MTMIRQWMLNTHAGGFALRACGCHARLLTATAKDSAARTHEGTWQPVPPSRFDYVLPDERIASRPHNPRDQSRLLVCAPYDTKEAAKGMCSHESDELELDPRSHRAWLQGLLGAMLDARGAADGGDGGGGDGDDGSTAGVGGLQALGLQLLDRRFADIEHLLPGCTDEGGTAPGSAGCVSPLLVMNHTNVLRARLRGHLLRKSVLDTYTSAGSGGSERSCGGDGGGGDCGGGGGADADVSRQLLDAAQAALRAHAAASEAGQPTASVPPPRPSELLLLKPLPAQDDDVACTTAAAAAATGSVSPSVALSARSGDTAATWSCLLRGRKIRVGDAFVLRLGENDTSDPWGVTPTGTTTLLLVAQVLRREGKEAIVRLHFRGSNVEAGAEAEAEAEADDGADAEALDVQNVLQRAGEVPLPPYMRREADASDVDAYQTVFAGDPSTSGGSVAAPTAGLHFTSALLERLRRRGARTASLALHVGWGTFSPLGDDAMADLREHEMHSEVISVPLSVLGALREAVGAGAGEQGTRPIVAVGTTSVRTLESVYWWGCRLLAERQQQKADEQQLEAGATTAAAAESNAWNKPFLRVTQWDAFTLEAAPAAEALAAVHRWAAQHKMDTVDGSTQLLLAPAVWRPESPVAGDGVEEDVGAAEAGSSAHAPLPGLALCDALLTNFHQPQSTLLLLVAVLLAGNGPSTAPEPGVAQLRAVYEHALGYTDKITTSTDGAEEAAHEGAGAGYRFLSYGDACLFITPDASKVGRG